jgi:outer membrane biosynthesis protein TonB
VPRFRYGQFLLYSLLIHFLLVGIFSSGLISMEPPPREVHRTETTLTLMEPPVKAAPKPIVKSSGNFIPTMQNQSVAKANPNAPLESEFNTQQISRDSARDPHSALPDLHGDPHAALNYYNIVGANTPSQTVPQNNPANPTKPAPPEKPQAAIPPKPRQMASADPAKTPPEPPNALPVLPEIKVPTPEPPKPAVDPQTASRPPPTPTFSLSKARSDIRGSGVEGNLPSPEARETELGRYKSKIYRAIGSRWYLNVDIAKTDLSIGTVRIKFFIQSNGVVNNLEVVENTGSQMLHTISLKAILDSAPFEPFSEAMKQQLGDGYSEEFTFSIY